MYYDLIEAFLVRKLPSHCTLFTYIHRGSFIADMFMIEKCTDTGVPAIYTIILGYTLLGRKYVPFRESSLPLQAACSHSSIHSFVHPSHDILSSPGHVHI